MINYKFNCYKRIFITLINLSIHDYTNFKLKLKFISKPLLHSTFIYTILFCLFMDYLQYMIENAVVTEIRKIISLYKIKGMVHINGCLCIFLCNNNSTL